MFVSFLDLTAIHASQRYCSKLARNRAFSYLGLLSLPKDKRIAAMVLFAWNRILDDIVDANEPIDLRRKAYNNFKALSEAVFNNQTTLLKETDWQHAYPWLPAFYNMIHHYQLDPANFRGMLQGQASELDKTSYLTEKEVYQYCYHVASVVGLTLIEIIGIKKGCLQEARASAEKMGVAVQMTNIIRDFYRDAVDDRVYLPPQYFKQVDIHPLAIIKKSPLLYFEGLDKAIEETSKYFSQAAPLIDLIHPDCRLSISAIWHLYSALLVKISRDKSIIFTSNKVRLTWGEKVLTIFKSFKNTNSLKNIRSISRL